MSKTKAVALTGMLAIASLGFACNSGDERAGANANANAAKPTTPATNAPVTNAPAAAPAGTQIAGMSADTGQVFATKCAGCHGTDAKGNKAAPNLFEVRDKHTSAEWEAYLKNTKIWEKDNRMPIIPLADDERKKLADWLAVTTGQPGAKGESAEGDEHEKGEKNEKAEHTKKS